MHMIERVGFGWVNLFLDKSRLYRRSVRRLAGGLRLDFCVLHS